MRTVLALSLLSSGCCFAPSAPTNATVPASPPTPPIAAPVQPPIARVPVAEPVFAVVSGVGVVRYDGDGFEPVLATAQRVSDVAFGPSGEVHVVTDGVVRVLDGPAPRELPLPAPGVGVESIEVAPTGSIVATAQGGFARFEDGQWTLTRLDAVVPDPWQLDGLALTELALDRAFRGVACGSHDAFEEGTTTPRRLYVTGRADENWVGIAWSWEDLVLIQDHHVYRRDASSSWTHIDHPLGDLALRSVAVGADGTIAVGAIGAIAVIPREGEVRTVFLAAIGSEADWVASIARDAEGRTWVGSDRTLAVLGPDLTLAAEWNGDRVPLLQGGVERLAIRLRP